jgi:hypothetical protein
MNRVSGVLVRQTMFGLVLLVLSLLVLGLVQAAIGLGAPPRGGVILVGASVVFACVSGGVLGMTIGAAARTRRFNGGMVIALLAGLVWGSVLCTMVAPLYLESALDAVVRQGAGELLRERRALLNRDTGLRYAVEAAKTLAWSGAGRLPILSLLVWTLLGPAIAGAFEARWAMRR